MNDLTTHDILAIWYAVYSFVMLVLVPIIFFALKRVSR